MNDEAIIAERSVLCSILEDGNCIREVLAQLRPEHFYGKQRKDIYQECINLYKQGRTPDPAAIYSTNGAWSGEVQAITGTGALSVNVLAYAEKVIANYKAREFQAIGKKLSSVSADSLMSAQSEAITKIQSLATTGVMRQPAQLGEIIQEQRDNILNGLSHKGNIKTGFATIDEKIPYLTEGNIYLIGARPGGGKSAFALNIAINIAQALPKGSNKKVLYYNMEMLPEEMAERVAAFYTGIPLANITKCCIPENRKSAFNSGMDRASALPIEFGLVPASPNQIISDCQYRSDIAAVIVDYLQIMQCDEKHSGSYERATSISQGLKNAAIKLKLPFIVLCQLNRDIEKRESRKPKASDLRDSGQIEQDAYAIILLWDCINSGGTARKAVSIVKNRNGECADLVFNFNASQMRFNEVRGEVPIERKASGTDWGRF